MSERKLSAEQEKAIRFTGDRLQIVACAGSGKTEVLSRRAAWLLDQGADPASIIAFTYTEKAAAELKSRIERRAGELDQVYLDLPPVARGMFIGTTHGWSFQMLQEIGGNYELMDALTEEEEWALLLRIARRLGIVDLFSNTTGRKLERIPVAVAIEHFHRNLDVVFNEHIDEQVLREDAPHFYEVFKRYGKLLYDMRLMPFRSMIDFANREMGPGGNMLKRVRGKIRHVLVDEYQDFNRSQNDLLNKLIQMGASVTVVGDDDQAIYQWRGGDVRLFTGFGKDYEGVEQVMLDRNHRCRPEIVDVAGALAKKLPERLEKEYKAHRESVPTGGVEMMPAETPEMEARMIAIRIGNLIKAGHKPGDIAVLYRSVRNAAQPLIDALNEREIPFTVIGKTSLLVYDEMRLITRLFIYWTEGSNWYPSNYTRELVTRPLLIEQIEKVSNADEKEAEKILNRLDQIGERIKREGVSDIIRIYNEMLNIMGLPEPSRNIDEQEKRLGQMSALLAQFDHSIRRAIPEYFYKLDGLSPDDETLEDLAINQDEEDDSPQKTRLDMTPGEIYLIRLKSFLQAFAHRSAEETPDAWKNNRDKVQIMTVHQAKGLQFPIVFVPSMVEGRFPVLKSSDDTFWHIPESHFDKTRYEGREEDEARLFYVALTRAKELVVVSWYGKQGNKKAQISRFITEYLREILKSIEPGIKHKPELINILDDSELPTLSFTDLVTFMECGYRYRLRHIYGFRSPKVPAMGYGKVLHHVIAEMARKTKEEKSVDVSQVDTILNRSFYLPYAKNEEKEKLKEAANKRIRYYLDHFGDELLRVRDPEFLFEVPVKEARIRGKIDLMLHEDGVENGHVELIDFKTAETRPPREFHANQLRLYATAAEKLGLQPVSLSIHDLDAEHGVRIPISFDEKDKEHFSGQLEDWIDKIRTGTFEPTEDLSTCRKCDFRSFCQHGRIRK